jgi:hypothetical protein
VASNPSAFTAGSRSSSDDANKFDCRRWKRSICSTSYQVRGCKYVPKQDRMFGRTTTEASASTCLTPYVVFSTQLLSFVLYVRLSVSTRVCTAQVSQLVDDYCNNLSRVSKRIKHFVLGLPPGTEVGPFLFDPLVFMGHLWPPSGVDRDENAYIMKVKHSLDGYIDARALIIRVRTSDDENEEPSKRRLDENPSACAHLINHSNSKDNVRAIPFKWADVLPDYKFGDKDSFDLPNVARRDGAPHYILVYGSEMTFYEKGDASLFSVDNIYGVVLCAMLDIDTDEELLLDYGLRKPLPSWASEWYDSQK